MSLPPPLYFVWDGETMAPMARFAKLAEQSFERGRAYKMVVSDDASSESRRHYFAAIREAWSNLPEAWEFHFASPEHLRKWAMIRTGFCNTQTWNVPSHAEAIRTARALRSADEFAVVLVEGGTLTMLTAKSTANGRMSKAEFQKQKTAVLDYLAAMIETTPKELAASAGRAA